MKVQKEKEIEKKEYLLVNVRGLVYIAAFDPDIGQSLAISLTS